MSNFISLTLAEPAKEIAIRKDCIVIVTDLEPVVGPWLTRVVVKVNETEFVDVHVSNSMTSIMEMIDKEEPQYLAG